MLDVSQRRFAKSTARRVRLLAPAGSGKTLSLLHRCANIGASAPADRFLLVTFTKAARNELIGRLQRDPELQSVAGNIRVTTLNAWGFRQVKQSTTNASLLSTKAKRSSALNNALQPVWQRYPGIATALTDSRRKTRAGEAIFEAMESLKTLGFRHDQVTRDQLEKHKNWLTGCGMESQLAFLMDSLGEIGLVDPAAPSIRELRREFIPFWVTATKTLRQQGLITFEDQKYWPFLTLDKGIQDGRKLSGAARTHHVVVDEFQDINPLDLGLLAAITSTNDATLTLAGDDDQAIYEWRGASPEFILNPDDYLGGPFNTFVLGTNYRSPRNIVQLSQKLIANNERRVPKEIRASRRVDAEVSVHRYRSNADCIYATTEMVQHLLERSDIGSVALISRKRSQIIPYQITFAATDIPFYAAEDLNINLSKAFTELKEILAIRGQQEAASPFGPGPAELLMKLCEKVKRYPLSKADRASLSGHLTKERPVTFEAAVTALRRYRGTLKGDNGDGRMSGDYANAVESLMKSETVSDALHAMSDHFQGLQQDYGKSDDDIYYADPPFFYLAAMAEGYGADFARFYRDIDHAMRRLAQVQSDDDDQVDQEQLDSRLHLMTALRAKGREFDAVVVLDVNDGIWPSRLAESPQQKEQERRLFYVATTRPKKHLAYVFSDRLLHQEQVVSPYLAEMGLRIPPPSRT